MNTQTKEVVGATDVRAPQPNAAMVMLGESYAKRYYAVMVIFASLVAHQDATCLPPMLTMY